MQDATLSNEKTRLYVIGDVHGRLDLLDYAIAVETGMTFLSAQCRIVSVGLTDVVRVPLPASLHFLYPILRLPLWLWRRSKRVN